MKNHHFLWLNQLIDHHFPWFFLCLPEASSHPSPPSVAEPRLRDDAQLDGAGAAHIEDLHLGPIEAAAVEGEGPMARWRDGGVMGQ